jgi:hypothetical protein
LISRYWSCTRQGNRLLPLIALADHLEQQAGLQRVQGQVADFVNDEELGLDQDFELAVEAIAVDGRREASAAPGHG